MSDSSNIGDATVHTIAVRRPDFVCRKARPAKPTLAAEFRLLAVAFSNSPSRVEVSCWRAGQCYRGWAAIGAFPLLESMTGRTVRLGYHPVFLGNEPWLQLQTLQIIGRPSNPLETLAPKWLPNGGEQHVAQLFRLVDSLASAYQRLVLEVFSSDATLQAFLNRPASLGYHHAKPGGLLEHTMEVALDCERASDVTHGVDRDLTLTAALLHDVGKCLEYEPNGEARFARSRQGELELHKLTGVRMITLAAARAGTEEHIVNNLVHCVTACAGSDYMGLPWPKLYEAVLVSTADARSSFLDRSRAGHCSTLNGMSHRWQSSRSKTCHVPMALPSPRGVS